MDLKELDAILGSAEKRPVTETFSKKGNIVYTSYKSALESGRAKAILEAKPNLVRRIHTKDKFYPAIALNINVSDLPTLNKKLVLRNDFIDSSLKNIISFFKSKVNLEVGHVKLLFNSAPTRNKIIERQNVSAFGRKFHAVELDWNREVRRTSIHDEQVSRYHESIKNNPNKYSTQQISLSLASPASARQTN